MLSPSPARGSRILCPNRALSDGGAEYDWLWLVRNLRVEVDEGLTEDVSWDGGSTV